MNKFYREKEKINLVAYWIRKYRNPIFSKITSYSFEGYDNVFRYIYDVDTDCLRISIKQFSSYRWAVDTDFRAYNIINENKVISIFRWATKLLNNREYDEKYALEIEYPNYLSKKGNKDVFTNKPHIHSSR